MYKKVIIVSFLIVLICFLLMAEKSLERIGNELEYFADSLFTAKEYLSAVIKYNEAIAKFEEAKEKDRIPVESKIKNILDKLFKANYFGGKYNDAISILQLQLKSDPSNSKTVRTIAQIYEKNLKELDEAIEVLIIFDKDNRTFKIEKEIASLYLDNEDYNNSLIWYKKAYELKKDSKVIQNIATLYLKLGDNQAAVKAYEDFIQTNPKESVLAKTYKNMGALYEELKNGTKAIECYEKSNALKYDNNITLLLITKYYDNKYYNKALEKIALLLENKPNNSDAIYYRAMIKFDRGEKNAAKADFTLLLNDSKYKKVAQGFIESIESE